jgi:hypothetical protein
MRYFTFFVIAIVCVSFILADDPNPGLDNDWIDFKTQQKKDYKNDKSLERSSSMDTVCVSAGHSAGAAASCRSDFDSQKKSN